MKKQIVLITGGAGFIGSHTADALARRGYKIRILDNLEPAVHKGDSARRGRARPAKPWRSGGGGGWPKYVLGRGYKLIRGDVQNKRDWARALRGVSYVYHIAAYQDQRPDFGKFFEVNTVGTSLLYELIAEKKLPIKKIIVAGTQFVYGDGLYTCIGKQRTGHPMSRILTIGSKNIGCPKIGDGKLSSCFYADLRAEEDFKKKRWDILCSHKKPAKFMSFREDQEPRPTNAYGLSKLAAENLALRFGKTHKIPTTILRYSIVQGPRQSPHNLYSGAIRIFVMQALSGRPITVFEDGMQTRDFVSVKDVVAANLLALKNKKTDFGIYNVGGGKAYRVLDFAEMVKRITGSKSQVKIGGFRRTDTRHAVSDISKLKKLGWRPRFTPEDSVREYLEWYRGVYN